MGDLVHIGGFTDIADKVCATVSADPAVHYGPRPGWEMRAEWVWTWMSVSSVQGRLIVPRLITPLAVDRKSVV